MKIAPTHMRLRAPGQLDTMETQGTHRLSTVAVHTAALRGHLVAVADQLKGLEAEIRSVQSMIRYSAECCIGCEGGCQCKPGQCEGGCQCDASRGLETFSDKATRIVRDIRSVTGALRSILKA